MPTSNQNVTATLRLNGQQQFAHGMQQATNKTNGLGRSFRTVGSAGIRLGHGIGRVGLGVAGAGAAIAGVGVALGVSWVQAARESAKVGADTTATLKSTGNAARVTAQHVGDLSTAISNKTGMDDEAIQSGANMLLTFTKIRNEVGKGNNIFDQATTTVADLAAKMGTDPSKAAIQLGKALNDPVKGVTALTKVGVTFDAGQRKTIAGYVKHNQMAKAQKVILRELNKEFGGQAAAQHDGIDKLSTAWGNLQEQLGGYVLPYVNKLGTWLSHGGAEKASRLVDRAVHGVGQGASFLGRGLKVVEPYARRFLSWARGTLPFLRSLGNTVRDGVNKGLHNLEGSLHRNGPLLSKLWDGVKAGAPPLLRMFAKLQGFNYEVILTALGSLLDLSRVVATGLLQIGRAALKTFQWMVDGAADTLGWVPGIGPKLKAAKRHVDGFVTGANTELSKIEKDININVDTKAADAALAAWHPAVNGIGTGVAVGVSSPAVIAGRTPATGRKGGGTILQTVVQVDRKPVAKATNSYNATQKAWR